MSHIRLSGAQIALPWALASLLLVAGCKKSPEERARAAMAALTWQVQTALASRADDDESFVIIEGDAATRFLDEHELEHLSIYILEDRSTQSNTYRRTGSDSKSHVGSRDLDLLMFRAGQNVFGRTGGDETRYMLAHRRIEGQPIILEVCLGD